MLKQHIQHLRALGRNAENSRCSQLSALKGKLSYPTRESPASSSPTSLPLLALADSATPTEDELANDLEALLLRTPETPPTTPMPKRSRTSHLQTPPPAVNMQLIEGRLPELTTVTAALQSALTNPCDKLKGFNLESLPVVEGRVVPRNFSMDLHGVYLRLPQAVLPTATQKLVGKSNYTITSAENSAVQIQLNNKCFFIVRMAGAPWPKTSGSPLPAHEGRH